MIGQNGWLERTGVTAEKEKKTPQKKTRILDSIKKIAKDMVSHESLSLIRCVSDSFRLRCITAIVVPILTPRKPATPA